MMNRREVIHMAGCACAAAIAGSATAQRALAAPAGTLFTLPKEIGGVRIPDTELCQAVAALVHEVSPEPLFNHVARTFVFGARFGQSRGTKFDEELFFLAATMHDIGLTEPYIAAARFEVDGADAAARILRERRYPEAKVDRVWQAIALHSTMEIPERLSPEIALTHIGTFMDAAQSEGVADTDNPLTRVGSYIDRNRNRDKLPKTFFDQVLEALPQLRDKGQFMTYLVPVLRKKPHTAYLAFEADVLRRQGGDVQPAKPQ